MATTAGLRCAQVVAPDPVARSGAPPRADGPQRLWSPLGAVAAVAVYYEGDPWLASLVGRLTELR